MFRLCVRQTIKMVTECKNQGQFVFAVWFSVLYCQGEKLPAITTDVEVDGGVFYNGRVYLYTTVRVGDEVTSKCKGRCRLAKLDRDIIPDDMATPVTQYLLTHLEGCAKIGMSDEEHEGDWRWVDGSPVTNLRWINNGLASWAFGWLIDCGYICLTGEGFRWQKSRCKFTTPAVWEYDSTAMVSSDITTDRMASSDNTAPVTSDSTTRTSPDNIAPPDTTAVLSLTGQTTAGTETSTLEGRRPVTNSFALVSKFESATVTFSAPLWMSSSQSVVSCGGLCLERRSGCDVISFDKRTKQCVGYRRSEGAAKGERTLNHEGMYWKVDRLR